MEEKITIVKEVDATAYGVLDRIMGSLNKILTYQNLGLTPQITQLVENAEDIGIEKSHIAVYSGFLHLIHNLYTPEDTKRIVNTFVKIPKKKSENFFSKKTQEWVVTQLAKCFYRPASSMNQLEDKLKYSSLKCYHIMAHRIIDFHTSVYESNESYDLHIESLDEHRYNQMAKYALTLYLTHPDKILDYLKIIDEKNLKNNFTYHLNEEVNKIVVWLIKYGKNATVVDFADDVFTIADDTVKESLDNIAKERDEYSLVIRDYEKQISELKIKNNTLQIENSKLKGKPILTGLKVLVIGETQRKEGYKEKVEKHGGEFSFIDGGDEAKKSRKEGMKADLIFHITSHGLHIVPRQLKGFENVIYVNNGGLQSLENEILKLK